MNLENVQHREAKKLRNAFKMHMETSILKGDLYTDNQYAKDCVMAKRSRYQMLDAQHQTKARQSIGAHLENNASIDREDSYSGLESLDHN